MSLSLPFPLSLDYELDRQRRLAEQYFGPGVFPDEWLSAVSGLLLSREYHRPWRHLSAAVRDLGFNIKTDKDKFQVSLDVEHFAPEEISVKTADGFIVVEGRQEEKKDLHGYVSRQFKRRYALPEGCDPESVESRLSCDGVLTVVAPRKVLAVQGVRNIPITLTGPIRKEVNSASSVNSPNGDK